MHKVLGLISPRQVAALVFGVQFAALLVYFAARLMPEHTLPTRWPQLGRSRSRLADGLEGLVAAMLLMYSGGVALTSSSYTLLNDPSVRVPFRISVWLTVSILFLAIAHEAAGKGTRTALVARLLALCILAAGLAVAGLLMIVRGETRVRLIGLGALLAWASPTVPLMVTQHRALWLLVFVGWPIFAFLHVVLASMGLTTRSMMWRDPGDDDTLEFRLLVGTTLSCSFQSFELLACICAQERLPRHLPHERPKHVSVRHGASKSMLLTLALTGVAVSFIYQNFLPEILSPDESVRLTISAGSERHLLSRLRLVLPESPTDGATIWGVLAAFTVGALLVALRVARMRSESRLSKLDGTLEVSRLAWRALMRFQRSRPVLSSQVPHEPLVASDCSVIKTASGKQRGKRKAQSSIR
jgi:hypothetical protein